MEENQDKKTGLKSYVLLNNSFGVDEQTVVAAALDVECFLHSTLKPNKRL